jgi:hypothetical protein
LLHLNTVEDVEYFLPKYNDDEDEEEDKAVEDENRESELVNDVLNCLNEIIGEFQINK